MPDRQGYPFLVVRAAEEAVYQSKREGRDRVSVSR